MKKFLVLFLAFTLICSLIFSGCNNTNNTSTEKYEKEAVVYLNNYLKKHYKDFNIESAKCCTYNSTANNQQNIDNFVHLVVNIDSKPYNFYYEIENNNVYSDVHYYTLIRELNEYFSENDIFKEAKRMDFNIGIRGKDGRNKYLAIPHEIKTINEFKNLLNSNANLCFLNCEVYYLGIKELRPEHFNTNAFIKEFKDIQISIFNMRTTNFSNERAINLFDKLIITEDKENSDISLITYSHYSHLECDELTIAYNNHFFNLTTNPAFIPLTSNTQPSTNSRDIIKSFKLSIQPSITIQNTQTKDYFHVFDNEEKIHIQENGIADFEAFFHYDTQVYYSTDGTNYDFSAYIDNFNTFKYTFKNNWQNANKKLIITFAK